MRLKGICFRKCLAHSDRVRGWGAYLRAAYCPAAICRQRSLYGIAGLP